MSWYRSASPSPGFPAAAPRRAPSGAPRAAARADAAAAGPAADDGEDDAEALKRVRKRLEDSRKSNAALATSVLQMIGPYNWVACQNCGHRNNSGTRCLQCGHSIEFDVME